MKILWLSHLIPYPPKGGVLQRSHHLIKELAKKAEVDVLAFHQPQLLASIYGDAEKGLDIATNEARKICHNLDVFSIPSVQNKQSQILMALKSLVTKDPYNINWLKSAEYANAILAKLNDKKYDLVHFDTLSFYPFVDLIPDDIAIALDHHNIESHMLLRRCKNEDNFLKALYFKQEGVRLKKYENKISLRADVNITCSELDAQRLTSLHPGVSVVSIPNGVDTDFFKPNVVRTAPSSKKRIVFIGRLSWYPNTKAVTKLAVDIWPLLKQRIPGVECDIIGASPPGVLTRLSQRDSAFRVHGFVDNIHPYMSQDRIYVCPITDGGGTKLKILDALSMGMAIVADPIACEGIDVTDGESVVFAQQPQEYVDAIEMLFNTPAKMQAIADAARATVVNNYSYASIGKSLVELYEKTVLN